MTKLHLCGYLLSSFMFATCFLPETWRPCVIWKNDAHIPFSTNHYFRAALLLFSGTYCSGRGHPFNLTSHGIMGFTYSGSALTDFSDCELNLNVVSIHACSEFYISFTRLLCWLGPTVLFPMELFGYLSACSTKFYVQKTPDWSEKNILQPSHSRILLAMYKTKRYII